MIYAIAYLSAGVMFTIAFIALGYEKWDQR